MTLVWGGWGEVCDIVMGNGVGRWEEVRDIYCYGVGGGRFVTLVWGTGWMGRCL